jgi:hypothetical protein
LKKGGETGAKNIISSNFFDTARYYASTNFSSGPISYILVRRSTPLLAEGGGFIAYITDCTSKPVPLIVQ